MTYAVMLEIELKETKECDAAGTIEEKLTEISSDINVISCEYIHKEPDYNCDDDCEHCEGRYCPIDAIAKAEEEGVKNDC